jgi:hypothetical protein
LSRYGFIIDDCNFLSKGLEEDDGGSRDQKKDV